ncbi:reverse transcriptase domain-containing protein [Tanacetum coccineum]|uniref:Reverse transcriptase domain-containing protein n=1 Tax=Tanacetum coccineum TaxID=301880 RepID=A0ABQ5HSM5_9ASTR
MVECSALADLGASINLMPLSVWKRLSLPELTTTHMTLELVDRSITHPKGVAEDVFVKVGKFHFLADFIVVDFDCQPLRFNDEAIMFNLGHTSRYSSDHYAESVNQIDIIDVACDEYSQEVLGFTDSLKSGNPTSTELIIATSFPSLTPFEGDPFQLPPIDLKKVEVTKEKSSIEDPLELELKDLPSHLEYAYLEGNDKLPMIIAKSLKDDEKEALLKVLKSHKWAIAWKITDIKGTENLVADHLSRLENPHKDVLENKDINENFPLENLGVISSGSTPWFVDIANFHSCIYQPRDVRLTKKKILNSLRTFKHYFWDDPYLYRFVARSNHSTVCAMAKKPLISSELVHNKPSRGPYGANLSLQEKSEQGKISQIDEMPQNAIQVCEIFDVWGIDFMGPFLSLRGNKYILVAVDYLSEWVEAKALPTNDARVVVKFLKSLFARFKTPRAIISDRGTYFCNDKFAKVMSKYGVTHHLATALSSQTSEQVEFPNLG